MKSHGRAWFIVSVFDCERWCPVLQAKLELDDLQALRDFLGESAADDLYLHAEYLLEHDDIARLRSSFNIELDFDALELTDVAVSLFRKPMMRSTVPYLVHTGYELPLLIEGRKKLARMSQEYPPDCFPGEDRFDVWVRNGSLSKSVVVEPFERRRRAVNGIRTVYYTPVGEEWRVPAMRQVWDASGRSGGWNESFERLEGMLFGYEDWQNDWWIAHGNFAGMALCCGVTTAGLAWIEAAGFRALPPISASKISIFSLDSIHDIDAQTEIGRDPHQVALVRFDIAGKYLMELIDLRKPGPWAIPAEAIPMLNRYLLRPVEVLPETASKSVLSLPE